VVITGASTGIGQACALYLDSRGHTVLAGVRRAEDGDALKQNASERLTPILLDVTDEDSIRASVVQVEDRVGDAGLNGLVNNAGIAVGGPLEFIDIADFRRQVEVNLTGQVAVTQAYLPLLRRATGRIINMGSIGGRSALPFFGPYAATKFGLEAITDALRLELRPWGIGVVIIEPGSIKTPIWRKSASPETVSRFPPEAHAKYGAVLDAMIRVSARIEAQGLPAIEVAKAVEHALTARRPKYRYLVGRDVAWSVFLERLPTWLRDAIIARRIGALGQGRDQGA